MGKTQLIAQATLYAAQQGEIVINYQAELSTTEFSNIIASQVSRKSRNKISAEDYKSAAHALRGVQYYVGCDPTLNTVYPVIDLLEAAISRLGATVVVLDHLHHLTRNTDSEIQDQANAMQRLKSMAQKYGCKIIVIAQPRKANSANKGKLIHITDFKGSEAVTSGADAIFVLHRDYIKQKDPNNPPMDDYDPITEVHLLAARSKGDGPTLAKLMFCGDICTFSEISYEENPTRS